MILPPASPIGRAMTQTPDMTAQEARLKALRFRAWHRGTREADYMIGCFFDRFHADWSEEQLRWFETIIDEEDVDIMGWACLLYTSRCV